MKKNIFLTVFLLIVFMIFPNNVFADNLIECKYSASIHDGGSEYPVYITITLSDNHQFQFQDVVLSQDIRGLDRCKAGNELNTCVQAINEDFGGNIQNFTFSYLNLLTISNNKYTIVTSDQDITNTIVQNNHYVCPSNLTVTKSQSHSNDSLDHDYVLLLTTNSFNKNYCDNGSTIGNLRYLCSDYFASTASIVERIKEKKYDGGLIQTSPSSGTCCVYKSQGGTDIYVYSISSTAGDSNFSYAVCLGNGCMTAYPSSSKKAQMLNNDWSSYMHLGNCSNMPSTLYYGSDSSHEYTFSPNKNANAYLTATLDDKSYCSSSVYTDPDNKNDAAINEAINGITSGATNSKIDWGNPVEVNCEGIIGEEMLEFIGDIFHWIQILAPIFVIVISSVDFAGALLQDDRDAIKKATNKFVKRLIIAVALFFVPIILNWLLNIFNDITGANASTCGIGG